MSTSGNQNPYSLQSVGSFLSNNFGILVLIALFFAGGFFVGSLWEQTQGGGTRTGGTAATNPAAVPAAQPTEPEADLTLIPEVQADEPVRGADNPKVTLIEYSDYECPFCARFHPTTQQVLEEFGDDVALVYRHYPLPFHPNAQKSAEGGECVLDQKGNDAFWTYIDALFETTTTAGSLTPDAITAAAAEAGVDATAFKTCLDSGEMAPRVSEQMTGGQSAGIQGTPGTVIVTDDGAQELIPGALPYESVKASIEKYL